MIRVDNWTFNRVTWSQDVVFADSEGDWCSNGGGASFMVYNGETYQFDARLRFLRNTISSPAAEVCGKRSPFNAEGCRVLPRSADGTGCAMTCGSVGEEANAPEKGFHFPIFTYYTIGQEGMNLTVDNLWKNTISPYHSKGAIWFTLAISAQDQLRQRTAWSLSQIFVASVGGDNDANTETWVTYYDIFVRNAFGRFATMLKEVTYSPIMGRYLTYLYSSSSATSGYYPDENYAREIMQLFTIGLVKLYDNGTQVLDANGQPVPTYDSTNIMNFARVFTGFRLQAKRKNTEYKRGSGENYIDPMVMDPNAHDVFPKPDLKKGFLGDGYPWCQDRKAGSFLEKGARYEFVGYTPNGYNTPALNLSATSALGNALCGGVQPPCIFTPTVILPDAVQCSGGECNVGVVTFVLYGGAYYEYVPPKCVYPFFTTGMGVQVYPDGQIRANDSKELNRFAVYWSTGPPSPGYYTTDVGNDGYVRIAGAPFRNPPVFIRPGKIQEPWTVRYC